MHQDIHIKVDLHTHSISSGHHTTDTITDLARTAADRNLAVLGVCDHGPTMANAPSSTYFRGLTNAPKTRFGIQVLYGVEANILNEQGTLDLPEDILSGLDYVAAGMHAPLYRGAPTKNAITNAYLHAMENPYVRILVHPDDPKFPVDYRALVEGANMRHVLLEINEASLAPNSYRGDSRAAATEILRWCAYYHHPIILGSDSHGRQGVGLFENSKILLQECDFPQELVLNQWSERIDAFLSRQSGIKFSTKA